MKVEKISYSKMYFLQQLEKRLSIPWRLFFFCFIIAFFLWICGYARHQLFQSNVYDLGIFDQWFWLISKGQLPISSTTKVHVLADHGAWVIYIFASLYKIWANVNWLFITQSVSLSFTAVPIWWICKNSNLRNNISWFICGLWWLQPIVFNVNIFDFHPEVWAMPALAGCYLAAKKKNIQIDLSTATFAHASSIILGALSLLPGGLGTAEATTVGLLSLSGIPIEVATPSTILIRLLTLWLATIIGIISLLIPKLTIGR